MVPGAPAKADRCWKSKELATIGRCAEQRQTATKLSIQPWKTNGARATEVNTRQKEPDGPTFEQKEKPHKDHQLTKQKRNRKRNRKRKGEKTAPKNTNAVRTICGVLTL